MLHVNRCTLTRQTHCYHSHVCVFIQSKVIDKKAEMRCNVPPWKVFRDHQRWNDAMRWKFGIFGRLLLRCSAFPGDFVIGSGCVFLGRICWQLTGCTSIGSAFFVLNWSIETRRSLIDYSFRILTNANILFSILKSLKTTFLKRSLIGCYVKLTSQNMVT